MTATNTAPDAVTPRRTDGVEPASHSTHVGGAVDVNGPTTAEGSATGATTHDDWLDWRRSGIGASDIPVICGLSPWGSPWQVWASKLGRIPEMEATGKMKAGNRQERVITEMLTEDEGFHLGGFQAWCHHPEHHHHLATIDALRLDGPNSDVADALGVVEYKHTTDFSNWDKIPDHYMAQVQWQLHVTGFDQGWLACLRQGWDLSVFPVERDQAVIDALVAIADQFWQNVLTETPPAADDREATAKAIASFWPESTAVERIIPDELAIELRLARDAKNAAEARFDLVSNQIKALLADADTAVTDTGITVATWKSSSTTRLDTTALRKAHPSIVDEFSSPSISRRFLIKDPK